MTANSQYLKWFHEIEKALWGFFALFGDLCSRCARRTAAAMAAGKRKDWDGWCCCMIDNQVHDNWESLNAVQVRFNRNWYDSMRRPKGTRTLGNGPCPALGERGCRLAKCRPITCTTQLCPQMLTILRDRGVIRQPTHTALQLEDLIDIPDILPELYGIRQGRKITAADMEAYLATVKRLKEQFAGALRNTVTVPPPG